MALTASHANAGPFAHLRSPSGGTSPTPPSSILSSIKSSTADDLSIPRKVRPQYPRNTGQNHVEYILVAAFDEDRGPIMEHQYPGAISGDEHMLAELMLPDQTHMRNQDWTIFFLHKDPGDDGEDTSTPKKNQSSNALFATENGDSDWQKVDEDAKEAGSDDDDVEDAPPLIYVLNLVNTKSDSSKRRGASVKAMAICTRHSFLHIYKVKLIQFDLIFQC
jgi:hypothetical protein